MTSTLPVVERFHSLQGEGRHAGRSAFFIRLASCKVKCPWCDTKNSWSADSHPQVSVLSLSQEVAQAQSKGAAFVVLTGGEPLHHNLDSLCAAIRHTTSFQGNKSIPIHLETSGVDQISGDPNWITLSPKRHAPPQADLLANCQEVKIVIHEADDLIFAEDIAKAIIHAKKSTYKSNQEIHEPLLFLQPGWNSMQGQKLAIEHVKSHPKWRLSIQTHKWLGVL